MKFLVDRHSSGFSEASLKIPPDTHSQRLNRYKHSEHFSTNSQRSSQQQAKHFHFGKCTLLLKMFSCEVVEKVDHRRSAGTTAESSTIARHFHSGFVRSTLFTGRENRYSTLVPF
jgi:hypothetical protein